MHDRIRTPGNFLNGTVTTATVDNDDFMPMRAQRLQGSEALIDQRLLVKDWNDNGKPA